MTRVALKIGYDGTFFHGSAPQPGVRTVEGELREILRSALPGGGGDELRLLAASRTDKGVSALGNVWALDVEGAYGHLAGVVNAAPVPIWCFGVAEVAQQFQPRVAAYRWYRYLLLDTGVGIDTLREYTGLFVGEHDFAVFCKRDPSRDVDTIRVLERVEVHEVGAFVAVDLYAPSFLWNQVRRVVAALVAVARGEIAPERVVEALEGGRGEDLGVVPPEPLILMAVEYAPAVVFDPCASGARHAREWIEGALSRLAVRQYLLRAVRERVIEA